MAKKQNIFIVDDDAATIDLLKDELEDAGFAINSAMDGSEALKKLERGYKPDLVLMDVRMPVMNGVEVFKKIKAIYPELPVIMMTAYSVDALLEEAIQEGAFACLKKPLDIDYLIQLIRQSKEGIFVLAIDDDPNTLEMLKSEMTAENLHVSIAKSAENALAIIKQKPHDILLIDLKMPAINGLELYLKLKKIVPDAIAIMMTAHRQETADLVQSALKQGAYTCIYKPFDSDKIFEMIQEIVKKRKKVEKLDIKKAKVA